MSAVRSLLWVVAALTLSWAAPLPDDALLAEHRRLSTPSKEHEQLSALAGSWRFKSTYRTGPDRDPVVVEGTAVHEWTLGGRFLECRSRSTSSGEKIEGLLIFGFDRRTEDYTFVSFDTLGTYSVTGAGRWNRATYSFVFRGETTLEPIMGGTQRYRTVVRVEDPDRFVVEMWFAYPGADEVKGVEAVYTRTD